MKGFKVPPLMFTAKELATIMVGLNFAKSQKDRQLAGDASGVELKVKEVLPEELRNFMTSLGEKMVVDPFQKYGIEKNEGGDWYLMSSAIAQEKRVQFSYKTKSGNTETRKVDPYLLVFYGDHWNMIGKSHLRGEVRNFMLDRMRNLQILDEKITLRNKINIEGLIFRSNESHHKVILVVDSDEVVRFRGNLPAKIFNKTNENPKKIRLEFFFDNLDFINEWLLQFGSSLSVVAPEELKRKRKFLLEQMLSQND